jgi:hypothetical protein
MSQIRVFFAKREHLQSDRDAPIVAVLSVSVFRRALRGSRSARLTETYAEPRRGGVSRPLVGIGFRGVGGRIRHKTRARVT